PPEPTGQLEDIAKTAVSEVGKAPLRPFGFLGNLQAAGESAGEWISRKILGDEAVDVAKKARERMPSLVGTTGAPTTEDIAKGVTKVTGIPFHEPETPWGRRAGAIVGTATDPLSLTMGPGGVARKLLVGGTS